MDVAHPWEPIIGPEVYLAISSFRDEVDSTCCATVMVVPWPMVAIAIDLGGPGPLGVGTLALEAAVIEEFQWRSVATHWSFIL